MSKFSAEKTINLFCIFSYFSDHIIQNFLRFVFSKPFYLLTMEETEFTPKTSLTQMALTNGLLTGFVLILISLVFYLLNDPTNQIATYISYVVIIAGIVWSTLAWRRDGLGGYITYGQAVGIGSYTILFTALISAVYMFVFMQFIDPGVKDIFIAQAEEQILTRTPDIPDEQLDAALALTERMFNPLILAISTLFTYGLLGVLFSLITSAFLKKKAPESF